MARHCVPSDTMVLTVVVTAMSTNINTVAAPWHLRGDASGVTLVHESLWTLMGFHELVLPLVALPSRRHDAS